MLWRLQFSEIMGLSWINRNSYCRSSGSYSLYLKQMGCICSTLVRALLWLLHITNTYRDDAELSVIVDALVRLRNLRFPVQHPRLLASTIFVWMGKCVVRRRKKP